ncbi:hypothetical protein [Streptomyces sp. NBC_01565]|uniref:hypothetical protein n=1 Tax=Streptomyces sp. NBC_01565 TaxID=2975881 RepID=UPI0022552D39|nr:hypothetical protein [Streptomyces sp. NBC_01565]MCX4540493.1 hypothetical protein [Streptomyces sp. NBC_01565]
MKYRITAPEPFSGGIAGVGFANGHGLADADKDRRALAYFRQAGYVVEAVEEPAPEPAPEPVETDEGDVEFDPAQHNVDEVIDYLDSVADDEEETMRVLLAEAEGKNRKTITERSAS